MKPTLPTLATELVELIACWLGPTDLCSLRLVCNDLRQKSLRSFGACFTTVRTDLSQKSLQKLQEISENENLRLYVQKLLIKGNKPEELGQGFQWHRHSSGYLEAPMPGLEKLQYPLAHNLPNCRSFHIWVPGCGPKDEFDAFTPNDLTYKIIIVAGIPSDVQTRPTGTVDAKRFQMWQYRQPSFRGAWAHIQEIVLHQGLRPDTDDWGMDLILDATSLRKLSVNVGDNLPSDFLERLCQATFLNNLESFELAQAETSVETLSELIERLPDTLRVFSLSFISLDRLTDWPIILGRLKYQAPFLHSVSICYLKSSNFEDYPFISFPNLVIDPVVPESRGRKFTLTKHRQWREVFEVAYNGPRADKAMEKLVKAMEYCSYK